MILSSSQAMSLIVTGGSVAFAIAAGMWAYRLAEVSRAKSASEQSDPGEAREQAAQTSAVLNAFPGVTLVWDAADVVAASEWDDPQVFGSLPAFTDLLKLSGDAERAVSPGDILEALADCEAVAPNGGHTTLRACLGRLIEQGEAFSLSITTPDARIIDADGRVAGRRAVLWLADVGWKRQKEASEDPERDALRDAILRNPTAYIELMDKAPAPMWRLSSSMNLQWANEAFVRAVEANSLREALERDLALDQDVLEQSRKTLSTGERLHETRAVVIAGARRQLLISTFPISNGVGGVAADITRETQANETLQQQVNGQHDVLKQVDEAVAIFGPGQELAFHNPRFEELFSFRPGELTDPKRPMRLGDVFDAMRDRQFLPGHSNYAVWRKEQLERFDKKSAELPDELWTLPNDRELLVKQLRHPLGGVIMIFADRTEQLRLRRQFSALLKVQSATLDKLNEGVAVFGSDGRLRLVNSAFLEIWRLDADKVVEGMPFDDLVAACLPLFHDRDAWAQMKARVTDTRPEVRKHVPGEVRTSDERILSYFSRPLPDGATIIAFNDATAERELNEALRQRTEALETADQVKSDFVSHVSYQLRAPLQSVMGFSELLAVTAGDVLQGKQAEHLDAIIQSARTLDELVEDIIDIAAIDSDAIELELEEAPIQPALDSAVSLVQTRVVDQQAPITVQASDELGAILIDAQRLKQVVYKLLLNALQHTPAEGGQIEVGAVREGDGACVWVNDNGEGIELDRQALLFDPFQRGAEGGAGLGLTLVRELVEMHDGWVELSSEPGKGTRVACHFPGREPRQVGSSLGPSGTLKSHLDANSGQPSALKPPSNGKPPIGPDGAS